jgi:hypothetical protein
LADQVLTAKERAELRGHLFVLMREAAEAMSALEQAEKSAETAAQAAHEAGRASGSSPTTARRNTSLRRADFVRAGS